jgi:hypothetical protein
MCNHSAESTRPALDNRPIRTAKLARLILDMGSSVSETFSHSISR